MTAIDQSQRTQALDPGQSFIIQAPAGSGKTELLIQRYLRLLATVKRPESVLAITFTRKATQEMRERILNRLEAANEGDEPSAEHEKIAYRLAQDVLQRDKELDWRLLELPGRLQIFTIDGLCSRILARYPRISEQQAEGQRRVVEDARSLYREAARRAIEDLANERADTEATGALRAVLQGLNGNSLDLQNLLAEMLGWRDQWLQKLGIQEDEMELVLDTRQHMELEFLVEKLGADSLDRLATLLQTLTAGCADSELATSVNQACAVWLSGSSPVSEQISACHLLLDQVSTDTGIPFTASSLKAGVKRNLKLNPDEVLDGLKEVVGSWRDDALSTTVYTRFVNAPPLLGTQTGEGLFQFRCLLAHAAAQLQILFAETSQTDFQHIAQEAKAALGDEENPGAAMLAEDAAISHILMDEFQDTSVLQYELIAQLTSGWLPDDGRSLFLVGDPMQSIYRFRKAEVSLYNRVFRLHRFADVELNPIRLEANFRSREEVISWVNQEFPEIFSQALPVTLGHVGYVPVEAALGDGGNVRYDAVPPELGPAGEARNIGGRIARQLDESPDIEIAVLARRRVDLEYVARELRRREIPYEATNLEALSLQAVVQDLIAITRALSHPLDRVAWVALLRAPWCSLDPLALLEVAGGDTKAPLLQRMQDAAVLSALDPLSAGHVSMIANAMSDALAARHHQPLSQLVEVVWTRLQGAYACEQVTEFDNVRLFLELLAQLEKESPTDLVASLEEALESNYAGTEPAQVQLMTIHKAKGLEFDVVYLPCLNQAKNSGNNRRFLTLQEFTPDDGGTGVLMAPLKQRGDTVPGLYNYLGMLNREQEDNESSRLLYVAVTRARRELNLSGTWKWMGAKDKKAPAVAKNSWMGMLWHRFAEGLDAPDALPPEPVDVEEPPLLPRLYLSDLPDTAPLRAATGYPGHKASLDMPDRNRAALGEGLHQFLELFHNHWEKLGGKEGLELWLKTSTPALSACLRAVGAEPSSIPDLTESLQELLGQVLNLSANYVDPGHGDDSWAELVIFRADEVRLSRYILDRVFVGEDGRIVIIDYKTGEDSPMTREKWSSQLSNYQKLVELSGGAEVGTIAVLRPGDDTLTDPTALDSGHEP